MAIFYRVWFSYCSFGLLFNALLFFMWIGGMRFRSRQVNRIARSSLLIYLLHGAPFVANHLIAPFVLQYICPIADRWLLLGAILLFTLVVVTLCIIIDRLLGPIGQPAPAALGPAALHLFHPLTPPERTSPVPHDRHGDYSSGKSNTSCP